MTDAPKDPNDQLSWSLKELQKDTEKFLKEMEKSNSVPVPIVSKSEPEERLTLEQIRAKAREPDVFSRAFAEVKSIFENRGTLTLPPHEKIPEVSKIDTPVEAIVKEKPQNTSTVAPTVLPSQSLMDSMSALKNSMNGSNVPAPEVSWEAMDKITAEIRTAWVKVLSLGSNPPHDAGEWLSTWQNILTQIQKDAVQWGKEHQDTWSQWAGDRSKEAQSLQPWLNKNAKNASLTVPASMAGKGTIPSAPSGVPKQYVKDLQNCADFWEYAQASNNKIQWKNTPTKSSFEECRSNLEQWNAVQSADIEWKEKALDRYAVLEARITLRCESRQQSPLQKSSRSISKKIK